MINKIKRWYKTIPATIKATVWFTLCNVLQKGIQYVTLPFFLRVLSVEEYGQYIVFISWLSVIQIFATLNLSAGIFMTGMVRYENERDQYSVNMIGLSMVVTIVVGVIYFGCYNWIDKIVNLPRNLVLVIFLQSFFSPLFLFWSVRERYELRYKELTIITVLGTMISPLMSFVLLFLLVNKVLAISIGYISGQVCMGIYCGIQQLKKSKQLYNKKMWREALAFNIPLIPHYLSYVVLGQADRVMIDKYCGKYEAGIYGLAYQISNAINMVTSAFDAAFSPQIFMAIKQPKKEFAKSVNKILVFYICVATGVSLIAPELLVIFGTHKYDEAKWVMPLIIFSSFFLFLAGLFMKVEFYFKKNKYITFASTFVAILNIILNYIYINKYGYIAAAYTTMLCYTAFAFAHFFFMKKTARQNNMQDTLFDIKTVILLSILVYIIVVVVLALYNLQSIIRYLLMTLMLGAGFFYRKKLLNS